MWCKRISFTGYKRLAKTSCDTHCRTLAFVGSNEVGKSSLLEALEWLTADEAQPLPAPFENRSLSLDPDDVVVEATFALRPDDLALISELPFEETPHSLLAQRTKNGSFRYGFKPTPRRDPSPFVSASSSLSALLSALSQQEGFNDPVNLEDESSTPASWSSRLLDLLADPDANWSPSDVEVSESFRNWLRESFDEVRAGDLSKDLQAVQNIAVAEHPAETGRRILRSQIPKFLLFVETDRQLSTSHRIADEESRANLQPALRHLLEIAQLDVDQLWGYVTNGDDSRRETYIEGANDRLRSFFEESWNQSNLTVRLKSSGDYLELHLKELGGAGAVTNIEERSDGLRTFVALVAFLASRKLETAPVLLIDEAETHLHYDAQADLVGVLLSKVRAAQVFYTTHSPGCLPSDLGTGIRLLRKDQSLANASVLRADFWTNEEPGFAPLLYAMGASAAAFSTCRRAVLAEGPADMVLLPTLLRFALALDELEYQIAPGLAYSSGYGLKVDSVAAQVLYLTDGDAAGKKYVENLEAAGIENGRIFSLPSGWASEDLLDRDFYIETVNGMLGSSKVAESDLKDGQPIAKSLLDWGERKGVKVPGHVAQAYALIANTEEIVLADGANAALQGLHQKFMATFD